MPQLTNTSRLDFSHNWNGKLGCRFFTTLRLSSRFNVGDSPEIWLNGIFQGIGCIIDKKRVDSPDALNEWVCRIDTGYSKEETKGILSKMYPKISSWEKQPIYLYLVENLNKKKP